MSQLVIVIPAYNEESRIESAVTAWLTEIQSLDARLIVVNDGSRDGTAAKLDALTARFPRLAVIHQPNGGHSRAILAGYRRALESGAAYIFQADGDAPVSPSHFPKLWKEKERARFVIGYRASRRDPWHRKLMSAGARLLMKGLFGASLRDPNSPFRLYERSLLESLLPLVPSDIFAPNLLLSGLASRQERVIEVEVESIHRESVTASLNDWRWVKIAWRCTKEIIAIWRAGRYPAPAEAAETKKYRRVG